MVVICTFQVAIPVPVSVAARKHHDQQQVGQEKVYSVYASTSQFIVRGSQAGTQVGQGSGGRN